MTVSRAYDERSWWDTHTDRIDIWGEEGDAAWARGVYLCWGAIIDEVGPLEGRILDLGCGVGRLANAIAYGRDDVTVDGVDVSPVMLAIAHEEAEKIGVSNVRYHHGDGRSLPPEAQGPFDLAYSVLMFQHVPIDAVASYLRDIAGALVPGGKFLVQYVANVDTPGTSSGSFLSWTHSPAMIETISAGVGLDVVSHRSGLIYDEWIWTTMVRR